MHISGLSLDVFIILALMEFALSVLISYSASKVCP